MNGVAHHIEGIPRGFPCYLREFPGVFPAIWRNFQGFPLLDDGADFQATQAMG